MDERAALKLLAADLPDTDDDATVVDNLVITTDVLHETTDLPVGATRYTAGWQAAGTSLSDAAAMGASATCTVAAYATVELGEAKLRDSIRGARDVYEAVDALYVGGDLDTRREFMTAMTATGRTDNSVRRSSAESGDLLYVTDKLGRSAAAVRLLKASETDRTNDLFRFTPRVATGVALRGSTTSVVGSSSGLAHLARQLTEAGNCGFELDFDAPPIHDTVEEVMTDADGRRDPAAPFGEDFGLVLTLPKSALDAVRDVADVPLTVIGKAVGESVDATVVADGEAVPDHGHTHGGGE